MTDDANDKRSQPRRRAPESAASPNGAADDSMAALERLQSLTSATAAPPPMDAPPAKDAPPAAPKSRRLPSAAPRPSRLRPASGPRAGRMVARIAAPVVFLVAVLVLISIVSQSGIMGGKTEPVVTPTPKAGKTKSGGNAASSGYKFYVVKSGDTLSGIGVKFDVSTSELEALNPKVSASTLTVGAKIKVPKPVP